MNLFYKPKHARVIHKPRRLLALICSIVLMFVGSVLIPTTETLAAPPTSAVITIETAAYGQPVTGTVTPTPTLTRKNSQGPYGSFQCSQNGELVWGAGDYTGMADGTFESNVPVASVLVDPSVQADCLVEIGFTSRNGSWTTTDKQPFTINP